MERRTSRRSDHSLTREQLHRFCGISIICALGIILLSTSWSLVAAQTHVLVVGIGDYRESRLQPTHADIDAQAFANALKTAGIRDQDIVLLVNEQATREQIRNWFRILNVSPGDRVIIDLGGHTGLVRNPCLGTEMAEVAALLPYDGAGASNSPKNGAIDGDTIAELAAGGFPSSTVFLFIDASHGDRLAHRAATMSVRGTSDVRCYALSSCRDGEHSWEYPGQEPAGVFTSFLVEAMSCGDANRDGWITFREVTEYVEKVTEYVARSIGESQTPVSITPSTTDDGTHVRVCAVLAQCPLVERGGGIRRD